MATLVDAATAAVARLWKQPHPIARMPVLPERHMIALVERYLSVHLHDNALFLCERLFAAHPSEGNRHLLATCLVYAGRKPAAVEVLLKATAPANRYLCARYLVDLQRFEAAEAALLQVSYKERVLTGGACIDHRTWCHSGHWTGWSSNRQFSKANPSRPRWHHSQWRSWFVLAGLHLQAHQQSSSCDRLHEAGECTLNLCARCSQHLTNTPTLLTGTAR